MEEIRHASRIASVDDAIMGFSGGYDTIVGERGVTLSGGRSNGIACPYAEARAPIRFLTIPVSGRRGNHDAKTATR